MYFTVFYGVLDPARRPAGLRQRRPSARVPDARCRAQPERLEATAPPLGLATAGSIQRRQVPWSFGDDLLVLWTDGLVDARNEAGEPFGEQRLLDDASASLGSESPEDDRAARCLADAEAFGSPSRRRPHAPGSPDLAVPHAKRRLGQHFLTDPRLLARIADALEAGPDDTVLEIGPGPGGLTAALARARGRGSSPSRRTGT